MSLINEMLRDLEARRGPTAPPMDRALDGLSAVGAWPDGPARSLPWALLIGVGVVAAALSVRPVRWHEPPMPETAQAVTAAPPAAMPMPVLPVADPPRDLTTSPVLPRVAPAPDVPATVVPETTASEPVAPAPRILQPDPTVTARPAAAEPAAPARAAHDRERRAEAARVTDELRAQARAIEAAVPAAIPHDEPVATSTAAPTEVTSAAVTVERPGTFRREHATLAAPTTGAVELARARHLLQGGDRARGLAALKTYVLGHPRAHRARLLFARELLKDARRTEAEAVLRTGLALAPRHTAFAQLLAHLMFDDNRPALALEVLQAAAPPVTKNPDYHAFMAAICQQTGRHQTALELYRGIVAAHPAQGSARLGMAISLAALGNAQEAAGAFLQASLDSTLSRAVREYAQAEARRLERAP